MDQGSYRVVFAPPGDPGSQRCGNVHRGEGREAAERLGNALIDPARILTTFPELGRSVAELQAGHREIVFRTTYEYHADYGGPDIDEKDLSVRLASLSADGRAAELAVDGLRAGYIHELNITGLAAADGDPLAHAAAHYTLNKIPTPLP